MKILRIVTSIMFVIAVGGYLGYNAYAEKNTDTTYPTIECQSDTLKVSCSATEADLLQGVTAHDEKDGDLTSQILVDSISNFITPGESNIHYVVFDKDNHKATITRKIQYTDYEAPKFELTEPLIYTDKDAITVLDRIKASDKIEGNITSRIKVNNITQSSDIKKEASVNVEVSNQFGDVQTLTLPISIKLSSRLQTEITLKKYLVYVKRGQAFDAEQYLSKVTSYEGESIDKDKVKVVSKVDTKKAGVYEVNYYYKDEMEEGSTTLLVVVQ